MKNNRLFCIAINLMFDFDISLFMSNIWITITSYLDSDFHISLFMLSMWVTVISYFDCSHVSI